MKWIFLILSISLVLEAQASDEATNVLTDNWGAPDRRPEIYWQDTFYTVHRNGPQHILVYLSDEDNFNELLSPIIKLLGENSTCSIRIVTPEKHHNSLRRRMYISARAKLRPNQAALSTLTRELHFFKPEEWKRIIYNSSTGETKAPYSMRFSAILFDGPVEELNRLKKLVKINNGVIYLFVTEGARTNIKRNLMEDFNHRYMRQTSQGVLCVSTSDFPLMVQPAGALPLWHRPEDDGYLLPCDLEGPCQICVKSALNPLVITDTKEILISETTNQSPPSSPWQVREQETTKKD